MMTSGLVKSNSGTVEKVKEEERRKMLSPTKRCSPCIIAFGCLAIALLATASTIAVSVMVQSMENDKIVESTSIKIQIEPQTTSVTNEAKPEKTSSKIQNEPRTTSLRTEAEPQETSAKAETTQPKDYTTNFVVSGGYNGARFLVSSAIMSPDGMCSRGIPPLPAVVRSPQSVYFNNVVMVCGGFRGRAQKMCYQLDKSSSKWTIGPTLNVARYRFSMTKVGQDVYALGGDGRANKLNSTSLNSMEKLSLSGVSGEWRIMDTKLTSARLSHCTVSMETISSLILIGGYPSTDKVEEFNLATSTWKQLSPLPVDLSDHACVVWNQTILVSGGYSSSLRGTQKRVYQFSQGKWKSIGELAVARSGHAMTTLNNMVLVLGGIYGLFGYDTIEKKHQTDGNFRLVEGKLPEKRWYFASTQIPREMFPCF